MTLVFHLLVCVFLVVSSEITNITQKSRCLENPANFTERLPPDRCKSFQDGYSWFADQNDCLLVTNASCAITANKFKNRSLCLDTCKPSGERISGCRAVPLVFTLTEEKIKPEGGFRPRPCADAALRSQNLHYYDWNTQECRMSHASLCPGDRELLAKDLTLNSFASRRDCLDRNKDLFI